LAKNKIRYVPEDIENFKRNFELIKLKIFSNSGEILFSSDPKEIGNLNNKRYFREIVAKGTVIAKDIQKETKSLEGQLIPVDVVETYVPLVSNGNFQGAFEIYYDITTRKQQLDKLLSRSSALVFIIAFGLLFSVIVILFVENKTIAKRTRKGKLDRKRNGIFLFQSYQKSWTKSFQKMPGTKKTEISTKRCARYSKDTK
jgi:hypothetical protein